MLITRRALSTLTILVLGVVPGACALSTNSTSSQCHSQQDCLSRGPEFADTTCSPERVCVKLAVQGRACNTHRECADRNGGAPFICSADGRCVGLLTPECQRVFADKDDLVNDNTIFIGNIDIGNIDGATTEQSIDLARAEIKKQLAGGLPPAKPGGAKRPIAIVSCTTEPFPQSGLGSQAETDRALDHLYNDLKVPAHIGPFAAAMVLRGAQAAVDHNVLMVTQNSADGLSAIADNDLVFRSGFPDREQVSVLGHFLDDILIQKVYDLNIAPAGDPIRIALILDNNQTGVSENVAKVVKHDYKVFSLGTPNDFINQPNTQPFYSKVTVDLLAYKPHIVLWGVPPGHVNSFFVPLARAWPAAIPRPFHVTLVAAWSNFMVAALAQLPDVVRQRYYGVQTEGPGFQQADLDLLTQNLRFRFPELATQSTGIPTVVNYDAVYMLAYAIVALADQPLTGPNLAKGVRRVADASGGTVIPWGAPGLSDGFAALGKGQNLTFTGVSGQFLFDKAGDRPGNPEIFCVTQAGGRPNNVVSSGYSIDSATGTPRGALTNCN